MKDPMLENQFFLLQIKLHFNIFNNFQEIKTRKYLKKTTHVKLCRWVFMTKKKT